MAALFQPTSGVVFERSESEATNTPDIGYPFCAVTTVPPDFRPLRSTVARSYRGVDVLDRREMSTLEFLRALLKAARNNQPLLLNGSGHLDQVAAVLISCTRTPAALLVSECTWRRGTSPLDRLMCWVGVRLMDGPQVYYCVLSSDELTLFPRTWGVDPSRVVFTPYCVTLTEDELAQPVSADGSVFAGGDSMRDYAPLMEAARRLPATFVLAVTRPPVQGGTLPKNVLARPTSHEGFTALMRRASVVVVPMHPGIERSAGQQTYLNAMAFGKVVVVTDSPGVRDYIEPGRTGLVVPPGDAAALTEALAWTLDPANRARVKDIGERARDTARTRFSAIRYLDNLLQVLEDRLRASDRLSPAIVGERV